MTLAPLSEPWSCLLNTTNLLAVTSQRRYAIKPRRKPGPYESGWRHYCWTDCRRIIRLLPHIGINRYMRFVRSLRELSLSSGLQTGLGLVLDNKNYRPLSGLLRAASFSGRVAPSQSPDLREW